MNQQTDAFVTQGDSGWAEVGRPQPHESDVLHVLGEARYTDDLPELPGALHAELGLWGQAHAQSRADALGAGGSARLRRHRRIGPRFQPEAAQQVLGGRDPVRAGRAQVGQRRVIFSQLRDRCQQRGLVPGLALQRGFGLGRALRGRRHAAEGDARIA